MSTLILQGSTVRILPKASGDIGGKVDAVILKMHEPKVVVPDAAFPCELIANAGDADAAVNTRVVGAVVPKAGTPAAKVNGACTTAAATDGDAFRVASAAATSTGAGSPPPPTSPPPPPPPQAASDAAASTLRAFFTG